MKITVNIRYTGEGDAARQFAREMTEKGIVQAIRNEPGNVRYEYYFPMEDEHTVLLIDQWKSQEAIDVHHASPMMKELADLRNKYDLHMQVERYLEDEGIPQSDQAFIRK